MKTLKKYGLILILWTNFSGILMAQDGEALFKAKCNTCHLLQKNGTGPMLQGVKQKWIDAEEGDMLYEWVSNSDVLISSGRSKMAAAIKDFDASKMPAQDVKKEDVDAILDYVDNWTEPVATVETTAGATPTEEVTLLPNYSTNLNLFYAMIALMIALLIAIAMVASSIRIYIGSEYFKSRLAEKNDADAKKDSGGLKNFILLLIGTAFLANSANALDFLQPGEAGENQPWLLVENSDLYAMLVLNIVLLAVLLYLRRMFTSFVELVQDEKQALAEKPASMQKVGKLLTDVVPIEEEASILLHHEYDGIRELDNNLPPWWVWMFYGTIAFAVIYLFNYHVLGTSDLQIVAYNKEMKQAEAEKMAYRKAMAMNVDETNATVLTDAADLARGKELFTTNCVSCHGPKGAGDIGPNLTDNTWIYGYDIKDLYKNVRRGSPNGKMPEHESKMNPVEIQQVTSYVLSLPYTQGSEPQGEIVEDDDNKEREEDNDADDQEVEKENE